MAHLISSKFIYFVVIILLCQLDDMILLLRESRSQLRQLQWKRWLQVRASGYHRRRTRKSPWKMIKVMEAKCRAFKAGPHDKSNVTILGACAVGRESDRCECGSESVLKCPILRVCMSARKCYCRQYNVTVRRQWYCP